ncbi:MAG: DUF2461 domain-containing protein [Gilvibacter sp.]
MGFKALYDFLHLLNKNNNKAWMDANREQYVAVRDFFIDWLDQMNRRLATIDDLYYDTPGKKAINRINNNLMFFPNKPTYKDHFGAGLDQLSKQGDFYIELGITESSIGGGYWYPDSKKLKSIREAIDYNGDRFVQILEAAPFKKYFGQMLPTESLKRAPKGFAEDHPYIHLLKRKSFAALHFVSLEEVCAPGFDDRVEQIYLALLPFRRYLNEAVSV